MVDLNSFNHNEKGDPHSQYNSGKVFAFPKLSTPLSDGLGYGYQKVLSLNLANDLTTIPESMQNGIVSCVYLEFDILDLKTESNTFLGTVTLSVEITANSKSVPIVELNTVIKDATKIPGSFNLKSFAKVTSFPNLVESNGIIPATLDLYISTINYGELGIIPKKAIPKSLATQHPWGAINSPYSTPNQIFSEMITPNLNTPLITEATARALSTNQSIVDSVLLSGGFAIHKFVNGEDLNNFVTTSSIVEYGIATSANLLNSPFSNGSSYMVKYVNSNNWAFQIAMDFNATIKIRTYAYNKWGSWGTIAVTPQAAS